MFSMHKFMCMHTRLLQGLPFKVCTTLPDDNSHTLIDLSYEPDTMYLPSGDMATVFTPSV